MGNYKFRLSHMIPNAWFYKLKDMSKMKTTTTNHHKKPPSGSRSSSSTTKMPPQNRHFSPPRNSFYYSPKQSHFQNPPKFHHFHNPPTKSSPNRKIIYKPSPKHTGSTRTLEDFFKDCESTQPGLISCTCEPRSPISDIIIDVNQTTNIGFTPEIEPQLPPIVTNPQTSVFGKKVKESDRIAARKSASGVKVKTNSPKVKVSKRIVQKSGQRKGLSESFVVVKSSFNPEKDFMQSMMEMINENNIISSEDLEELLACYLSLNSDVYHDVIIKAFEQIWFRLPDL